MATAYKILIAEDDRQLSKRLGDFLNEKGFDVQTTDSGSDAIEIINTWRPKFVLVDLMMPGANGIQILKHVRNHPGIGADTKVLITSGHNNRVNVEECLHAGADDYVIKPFKFEDFFGRLLFHLQRKRKINDMDQAEQAALKGAEKYLHLLSYVFREANSGKKLEDTLHNLTKMLAITLSAVRCNIIECSEDRQQGFVLASSDSKTARGIKLDLNRYPEVLHVMNTEKIVVLDNLDNDPVMAEIKKFFVNVQFNALIVAPVRFKGKFFGVLSARMPKEASQFSDLDIRFLVLLAQVVSLVLSSNENVSLANVPQESPAA